MKKIISLLLCVLLIGQSMGIVFASGEPINVAKNAAAFAYGTEAANDASLAVDGDEATSWISLNDTVLKDYLILDLGNAYSIDSIKVMMPEAVAQNFTVFGSNDPAQADREELTGKISGLTPGVKEDLGTILDATAYRYIVFEQDAAETSFGFTEIEVITQDESAASQKAYGPVELVSFEKNMKACTNVLNYDGDEANKTNAKSSTDSDPTTFHVRGAYFTGVEGEGGAITPATGLVMFMVDLGTPKTLSHVAYQYGGSINVANGIGKFVIVGSNNATCAKLTDAQGNPTYDVLATFDSEPTTLYQADSLHDTGLLVFPVAAEYQSKAYQYVGILKAQENDTTTQKYLRFGASTIQAYTKPLQMENIAENKPAFSYNSQKGTSPSFAVDGDPATYWKSASTTEGSSVLYDNFVIDLGEKCPVYEIDVQLADNTSAKNFTIYGSENLYDVGKTKLCDVTAANITNPSGLNKVYKNDPASYRYIVFEHKPDGTDMGFAEIEVKSGASASGSGSVVLMSAGKPVTSSVLANYTVDTSQESAFVTDGNQETRIAYSKKDIDENLLTTFIDLGMSLPVSHVLYQGTSKGYSTGVDSLNNSITAFKIVATNDVPSPDASYVTLAEKTGFPPVGEDGFPGLYESNLTAYDTGLWVFPVTASESYRYIGIVTDENGYNSPTDTMRAHINTLQVYAKNSDVAAQLKNEGKKRLIINEKTAVADDAVSYESYVLNGDKADALIGLFGQYDAAGKLTERYYAQTSIPVAGAFADIVLKATGFASGTTGNWDLLMLEDRVISDYISNLEDITRPASYEGTAGSEYKYERIGNTFTITGKADCGVLGMLVLKQGASLADFGKDDIYTYQLAKAPQDAANPWDFTFVFDDVLAAGDYKVALFSDNEKSELLKKTETFTVVDEGALKTMFKDVDKNASFDLKQVIADNALFFGSELKKAVDATNSETISATVKLAAEAMAKGLLDGKEYNWSEPSSAGMTSLIKVALVMDACYSGKNVVNTITSYGDAVSAVFDCDDYKNNTADFETLVPLVLAEDKPATAENLVKAFKRAIALSMIAGGTQEDRHKALENYKSELGIEDVLAETDKTPLNIAQMLSNDMTTVTTVYTKGIKEAVGGIIEDLSEQGGGGLTSLGSQGSGKNPSQALPSLPRDVIGTQDTIGGAQMQTPQSSFSDVANHGWAQEAIERLAGLGILAGNGDGTFNPDGLLTREQAVKLLILTLDLSIDASQNAGQADNGYTDCDYEAWYYPYVTYAKVNKLVNGVGESEFGVGNLVTRQDLAVMIHRALKQKKVTMENSKAFADDDAVSAYAKTAVGALGDMGLITGFPDGSFGPQETTTRAQAAVIFARFMDVLAAEEVAE